MRADDERDPLDSWLNQQVKPLPPPPGTFELITRRARGRKLRKLAVTVVSAAAVAAAVAIAVPVGLNLHLTTPSSTIAPAAEGGTSPTEKPSTAGSATPIASPTPSRPATTPPTTVAPAGGLVPRNFKPSSVTFIGPYTGWVIGQAGTPGTCYNANPDICTSIARTDNAGASWRGEHAPSTSGPSGAVGVSGVRFLNQTYGWAFGPELWATTDGGETWNQVRIGAARVTDLEASDGRAYALFATCSGTSSVGFAYDCASYTLKTTIAGSGAWTAVGGVPGGLASGGQPTSAVLALTGTNGYLLAPDKTLYSGPIGGTWSQVGTSPCPPGTPQFTGLPSDGQLALQTPTTLAIACEGLAATAPPTVYSSADSGASWSKQPNGGLGGAAQAGLMTSFSVAPNDTLVLATTRGIYYLPSGAAQWQPSSATGSKAPRGGFSYVGMTTSTQGVALPANTSLGEIWMTFDGGATWNPSPVK